MSQRRLQTERLFREIADNIVEISPDAASAIEALQIPDRDREIIPHLITEGKIEPSIVAQATAKKLGREYVLPSSMPSSEIEVYETGLAGVIFINDMCVMVNPYDEKMLNKLQWMVENDKAKFSKYGVMASDIFDDPRFSAKAESSPGKGESNVDLHQEGTKGEAEALLEEMIRDAVALRASDIHIAGGATKADVRVRVDGRLRPFRTFSMNVYKNVDNVLHEKTGKMVKDPSLPFKGDFSITVLNTKINIRVESINHQTNRRTHRKIVLRILGLGAAFSDIKELGLAEHSQQLLYSVTRRPKGIFLVTGPTGSGKSAQLGTLMLTSFKHNPSKAHYTLEKPVEAEYKHFYQIPIEGNLTFEEALESILRLDPDVIMVGEISSQETAELAIQAALTGHLVLATLHTNDSYGALGRLRYFGIDDSYLAETLIGASAQRLIPALCPDCRSTKPFASVKARLLDKYPVLGQLNENWLPDDAEIGVRHIDGCDTCKRSGLLGRVAVFEGFKTDLLTRESILNHKTGMQIRNEQYKDRHFVPMWQDAMRLLKDGKVCLEELFAALDESELEDLQVIQQ